VGAAAPGEDREIAPSCARVRMPMQRGVRLRAIQGGSTRLADQGPPPLRRACGHVAGDPSLLRRGYRYYRGSGLDVDGFFTRRFTLEDGRGASVTLVAGIDVETGAGMLERCTSTEQAAGALTAGPASIWAVVLTLENATVSWRELTRHLMLRDPGAFGAFAAELTTLPLLDADGCPLCSERARLAA
jgi:hypothetical protein